MSKFDTIEQFEVTFRSAKAGKSETLMFGDLPLNTQQAIVRYGAMRIINDKLGGLEPDEAAKEFDRWFEAYKSGNLPERGTGAGSMDPVEKRARSLARDAIKQAIKAKGKKLADVDKETMAGLVEDLFRKNEEAYLGKAKKMLEIEQATLDDAPEVDLGDI